MSRSRSGENLGRSRSRSRSPLGLGPERLVLQAHFQRYKFTEVGVGNKLSVGLQRTACRSRNLCFSCIDSLNPCIIKQLLYLV